MKTAGHVETAVEERRMGPSAYRGGQGFSGEATPGLRAKARKALTVEEGGRGHWAEAAEHTHFCGHRKHGK